MTDRETVLLMISLNRARVMFMMSLEEPPGAAGVVNGEVTCDTELAHEEITLDVPKLCPNPYTWPFFGAPDATTQMSGSNSER